MQPKFKELYLLGIIFEADAAEVSDPIVLAMDAESMQVLSTPGESKLKNPVQLGDTGVAAEQQTPPDELDLRRKEERGFGTC